jgi:hypothetical protein
MLSQYTQYWETSVKKWQINCFTYIPFQGFFSLHVILTWCEGIQSLHDLEVSQSILVTYRELPHIEWPLPQPCGHHGIIHSNTTKFNYFSKLAQRVASKLVRKERVQWERNRRKKHKSPTEPETQTPAVPHSSSGLHWQPKTRNMKKIVTTDNSSCLLLVAWVYFSHACGTSTPVYPIHLCQTMRREGIQCWNLKFLHGQADDLCYTHP